MDKEKSAKAAGLLLYDTAVPQQWINETAASIARTFYIDRDKVYCVLLSGVVWCYDDDRFSGVPVAVTAEAEKYKSFF